MQDELDKKLEIFPINIPADNIYKLNEKNKMPFALKALLTVMLYLFISFELTKLLSGFMSGWVTMLLITLSFILFFTIRIYRKYRANSDVDRNVRASKSDRLSQYYMIQDETKTKVQESRQNKNKFIHIFNYRDRGGAFVILRFKYGFTDRFTHMNNQMFTEEVQKFLYNTNHPSKVYVTGENYEKSDEYLNFLDTQSGRLVRDDPKCKKLIELNRMKAEHILEQSRRDYIPELTMYISFPTEYRIGDVRKLVLMLKMFTKDFGTSIRYSESLTPKETRQFVTDYMKTEFYDTTMNTSFEEQIATSLKYKGRIAVYAVNDDNDNNYILHDRTGKDALSKVMGVDVDYRYAKDLSKGRARIVTKGNKKIKSKSGISKDLDIGI